MSGEAEISRVNVEIFGQNYTIKGDKTPEYIVKIAHEVDDLMKKIHKTNPHLPPGKIAVLAALNIADELAKIKDDYQWLLEIINEEKNKQEQTN
ncbi:MAG: cell division protein ZapA [Bacillota bacterium]